MPRLSRAAEQQPLRVAAVITEMTHRSHADTLLSTANLGVNYMDAGRIKEAIPLLEEGYQASKKYASLRFAGTRLLDAFAKASDTIKYANLVKELLTEDRKTLP